MKWYIQLKPLYHVLLHPRMWIERQENLIGLQSKKDGCWSSVREFSEGCFDSVLLRMEARMHHREA